MHRRPSKTFLGCEVEAVYNNRLYRGLGRVLPLRSELFDHLRELYASWFGSSFSSTI